MALPPALRRRLLRAREAARRLRASLGSPRRPRRPAVELAGVQRRLEIVLAALYGRPLAIAPTEVPPRGTLAGRLRTPRHLRAGHPLAALDGETIHLPRALDAGGGEAATLDAYRLLAIGQAERLRRGTAGRTPPHESRLERDLYLLAESAAVDASVARQWPALRPALAAARARALARRPPLGSLTPPEREVELLIRAALGAEPGRTPAGLPEGASPADSSAWARDATAALGGERAPYRGAAPVEVWGAAPRAAAPAAGEPPGDPARPFMLPRLGLRLPGNRQAGGAPAVPGDRRALTDEQTDQPDRLVEDPYGTAVVPDEHGTVTPEEQTPKAGSGARDLPPGVAYPEWDYTAGQYRQRGVVVRAYAPAEGDGAWAAGVLAQYAPLVRRIRGEFEQLRARRLRLSHQHEGDELDLAACVRALVDRRTGHSADDRLYTAVRPARRGTAITLLVDVSGSTDAGVSGALRIIDLEKIALLLAGEALEALGDRYSVLTFSGHGANDVHLSTVKDASERTGEHVRRRIAALKPGGFTRLGAAVRHATALLSLQPTRHRLLLILSDGKPHDLDHYQHEYAIEDTRRAVLEARSQGAYPFCLAVDAEGSEYLPHVFGRAGHTVLRRPEQLPLALLRAVRLLLRPA